jgi:PncC family amidohydrolase
MADILAELARQLQATCLERGLTVAIAESCTGGLVAHAITEVPGASAYLRGGIVAYANEAKVELLGVAPDVIDAHGAVSAQVALAMADGARRRLGADLGAGVTGVAGPDGGTAEKPVGLTYIAVSGGGRDAAVHRFAWSGDRSANKVSSAEAVIRLLLERASSR